MLRNRLIMKLFAALLAVWYVASVVGFDVHYCGDNGRVYVESLLASHDCEDIHPDAPCAHHHDCCDHHSDACSSSCEDDEDCCTDVIEVLQISGEDHSSHIVFDCPQTGIVIMTPAADVVLATVEASISQNDSRVLSGGGRDVLRGICVLRV